MKDVKGWWQRAETIAILGTAVVIVIAYVVSKLSE